MQVSQIGKAIFSVDEYRAVLSFEGDCRQITAYISLEGLKAIREFARGDLENVQVQFGNDVVSITPQQLGEFVNIEVSTDDCESVHSYTMKSEDFANMVSEA